MSGMHSTAASFVSFSRFAVGLEVPMVTPITSSYVDYREDFHAHVTRKSLPLIEMGALVDINQLFKKN